MRLDVPTFESLLIVEIAGSSAGAYTGKLFADQGADVVLVEPPGGSAARCATPAAFAYENTSKSSWTLDAECPRDRERLTALLDHADAVIESSAPEPLVPLELPKSRELVRLQISPLGTSGPWSTLRSNELTDDALGGHLYLTGEPDREPIRRPGRHALYQAGTLGFIGALAALIGRARHGRGDTVEVTHLEGLASLHQYTTAMVLQTGHVLSRAGNAQGGHWHPVGNYACKDGHVALSMPTREMLEPFLEAAGLGHLLEDDRFGEDFRRGQHKREFNEAIQPWLDSKTAAEIVELGQRVKAPVGPVNDFDQILEDPHLAARGFWQEIEHDERRFAVPRGPFLIDGAVAAPLPAPYLDSGKEPLRPARTTAQDVANAIVPPLHGLRVLDLTRVWAGPLATRMLGDLGADVIKIEAPWSRGPREVPVAAGPATHQYAANDVGAQPWNRQVSFNKLNRGKRSLTLELQDPRGRKIFERLARSADLVIDNFSPRVMGKLGLGPEALRNHNPSLLCAGMPGFGATGPYRDWLAFGPLIESASGLNDLMGYRDSGPYRSGLAWPDPVTSLHAVAGVLVALWRREADPQRRGRTVEIPMLESFLCFAGDLIVETQLEGLPEPRRNANRQSDRAPQGIYECLDEESWIAISVSSDAQWRALCDEASLPAEWSSWRADRRHLEHDAIDAALAAWAKRQRAQTAMHRLQEHGVIAATVSDAAELVDNPQLAHHDFWVTLDHREIGRHRYPGLPIRFRNHPVRAERAAPCLGEHNEDLLAELDLSSEEIAELDSDDVIATVPPEGSTGRGIVRNSKQVSDRSAR